MTSRRLKTVVEFGFQSSGVKAHKIMYTSSRKSYGSSFTLDPKKIGGFILVKSLKEEAMVLEF